MEHISQIWQECLHVTEFSPEPSLITQSLLKEWSPKDSSSKKFVGIYSQNYESVKEICVQHNLKHNITSDEIVEPTDLLIFNSLYLYGMGRRSLKIAANSVNKYIIIRGTTAYEWRSTLSNEDALKVSLRNGWSLKDTVFGIWHAIIEFTGKNRNFIIKHRDNTADGYVILQRIENIQPNTETNPLMSLLTVYECDFPKIRLGPYHDNGYVIVDIDSHPYDMYIGCGIGTSTEFDHAMFQTYPYVNGICFDGTITQSPDLPYGYRYVSKNIGVKETETETNLIHYLFSYKQIFLKMDIEGWEFPWLNLIPSELLDNVAQIVIEIHSILENTPQSTIEEKLEGLKKLCQTHYIVHLHGNTYAPIVNYKGLSVPSAMELTLINKKLVKDIKPNTMELPSRWDFSNNMVIPDFDLNYPPFVNK